MSNDRKDSSLGFDPMAQWKEWQKTGFGPLAGNGSVLAEGMQNYFQEVARFIAMRLEKDIDTQKTLMTCGDIDKMREIQTKFFEEALEDYQTETARIMELTRSVLDSATEPGKSR